MPNNKSPKKSRKEIRHLAKLESGRYGSKQGKRGIQGYDIKNEDFDSNKPISSRNKEREVVAKRYKNIKGVKAKNIEGAIPVRDDYGKAKGSLGGGVGRTPLDVKREKLESVYSLSRKFKVIPDKNDPNNQDKAITKEEKGFEEKAKNPTDLSNRIDKALTKTSIGKDIKQVDKEFKEAPEFERNRLKNQNKPKYTKASRTVMQVIENADVKTKNAGLKEGSRKALNIRKRYLKKTK